VCLQVIEYSLLPLYDPAIPLESFMSSSQTLRFRGALQNATEAAWGAFALCTANCTTGYCAPLLDSLAMSVSYQCQPAGRVEDSGPAPLSAADMASELSSRMSLTSSALPTTTSVPLLQVGFNTMLGLPPHEQHGSYMRHESKCCVVRRERPLQVERVDGDGWPTD
jgi:hypothetical protein